MNAHRGKLVLAFVLAAGTGVVFAGEVKFTAGPTTAKAGEKVAISFTVSASTDVEVAVLDKDGKVVRHLAAGVLGAKNPPPEPLKPGLAQSLEWDGKDDLGQLPPSTVHPAPFKVRVRAGMGVKFGRLIGGSPGSGQLTHMAGSNSVATGPDGALYLKIASICSCSWDQGLPWQLRRFDREGKYERTLLPYPASTPPDRTPGFKLVDDGSGALTPVNRRNYYPVFFEFGYEMYHRVVDGAVVFVDRRAGKLNFFKPGEAAVRGAAMPGPKFAVAISPDGRSACYTDPAQGALWKQDLSMAGAVAAKIGKELGAGVTVQDVAAQGELLAADPKGGKILELGLDGAVKSETPVPNPTWVRVNRKTGELYVVSCKERTPPELLKVSGRGEKARIEARLKFEDLPWWGPGGLAVDESGAKPVVWLHDNWSALRIEDQGAALARGPSVTNADKQAIPVYLNYVAADPESESVYALALPQAGQISKGVLCRYDGRTGQGGPTAIHTIDAAVGPGGEVYAWGEGSYSGSVLRYTRELKPDPLPKPPGAGGRFGRGHNDGGMAVDLKGNVYLFQSIGNDWIDGVLGFDAKGDPIPGKETIPFRASEPNGTKQAPLVFLSRGGKAGGGLRVDSRGNIYVGVVVPGRKLPPGDPNVPKGFEKEPLYDLTVGTILKFGPEGGKDTRAHGWWERKAPEDTYYWYQGVRHAYLNYGCFSGVGYNTEGAEGGGCVCARSRFDLDRYDRLYVPSPVNFKVSVRDNNDNEIVRFGAYGNYDDQGAPGGKAGPAIPLGWPTAVAAGEDFIYVGDQLNCRIVRADKTWAAEAACDVK